MSDAKECFMTEQALSSLTKLVPDIGDYTDENDLSDSTKDLNSQVYDLFGIPQNEKKKYRIQPFFVYFYVREL